MRKSSELLSIFSGAALGLVLAGMPTSSSEAGFQGLASAFENERKAQHGIIRVQSTRQRETIDLFLQDNDFTDPDFVRRSAPRYFVEACRNKRKYLLMFSRNGDYFGRRRLGQCEEKPPVVSMRELRYWLEDRKYTDIRFTDRTPPTRVAEACLDGRQYTIRFDAAGKGTASRNWFSSACRDDTTNQPTPVPPTTTLTKLEARKTLRRVGYDTIRFDRYFADSKLVEACQGVRKFRLLLDDRARATARRAVGFCRGNIRKANTAPPRPDMESLRDRYGALAPTECQMVLNWLQYSDPIVFESASDTVSGDSRSLLQTVADNVDRCPRTQLRIEGHTDSIGTSRRNIKLSTERAEAVRDFLLRRDVPARRITVKGFGEAYPVTDNLLAADRARNRRIDLVLEWGRAEDLGLGSSADSQE